MKQSITVDRQSTVNNVIEHFLIQSWIKVLKYKEREWQAERTVSSM